MKKHIIFTCAVILSFCMGYYLKGLSETSAPKKKSEEKSIHPEKTITQNRAIPTEKVYAVGGIFFKSKDPKLLGSWYETNLGMKMDEHGKRFQWQEEVTADSSRMGSLQWSLFDKSSDYLNPSESPFMINYMVSNIDRMVLDLKKNNVEFVDTVVEYGFGKFVHVLDPEGNKIELFEPNYSFKMPE